MKKLINAIRRGWATVTGHGDREAGMATAEYAVGTVAVISFGGVLFKLISDPVFRDLLWKLVQWLFNLIMGLIGGGA
ncbi:MAG: DUF4244 domain-containing protein [Propionibacteriaceae bacterium]|jgi:hypothetical protein|nr:DUF4244 domain-containing protein [Propionibacteriaceae bacterium]